MRPDEQPDMLHTMLARSTWAGAPIAALFYDLNDDALVVELVAADAATAVQVGDQLLVEFDGTDSGARPTTVYLTGFLSHPETAEHAQARVVLGERLWNAATRLAADGGGSVEVHLSEDDARSRRIHWAGLLDRVDAVGRVLTLAGGRRLVPVIGVEMVPGRLHAVVTDGGMTILADTAVGLNGNEPADVVNGVAQALDNLRGLRPDLPIDGCPLGLHLGGPVDSGTGRVLFYDKPRLYSTDQPWFDKPLGELLSEEINGSVLVSNDAHALAVHEIETAPRTDDVVTALLLVRQGVGAKLIKGTEVLNFPMEIGVFMPESEHFLENDEIEGFTIEAGSGVVAIIEAVGAVTKKVYNSIDDAADAADQDPSAAKPFRKAGKNLARAVAAVQAIVNPDQWIVYAPGCLLDQSRAAGWHFVDGLEEAPKMLSYGGLSPRFGTCFRSLDGHVGAMAAATVVARRTAGGVARS